LGITNYLQYTFFICNIYLITSFYNVDDVNKNAFIILKLYFLVKKLNSLVYTILTYNSWSKFIQRVLRWNFKHWKCWSDLHQYYFWYCFSVCIQLLCFHYIDDVPTCVCVYNFLKYDTSKYFTDIQNHCCFHSFVTLLLGEVIYNFNINRLQWISVHVLCIKYNYLFIWIY
jgi:hypothetical protein